MQPLEMPTAAGEPVPSMATRGPSRVLEEVALWELRALIGAPPPGGHRRDGLIEHLHLLNDRYAGLFERHLAALALDMRIPLADVFAVLARYPKFVLRRDDEVPPDLTVRVCEGPSCALAGSAALLSQCCAEPDDGVCAMAVPCLGRCDQAPAVLLNQRVLARANHASLQQALARAPGQPRDVGGAVPGEVLSCAFQVYREQGGYALAAAVVNGEEPAEGVMEALEKAGLREAGGSGEVCASRWREVRALEAPRVLVVNVHDTETGSFKERSLLERDPHRFLEGMLIAAQVVGTEACYICLRDEYHDLRRTLGYEIERLQSDPPCPLPHIELRRSAGPGDARDGRATLDCIEGRCGAPRRTSLAQRRLFGLPVLEQHLETLYWVRDIVEKGPAWFSGCGRHGAHGLRLFSVSGRVGLPGVKQAPAGITLQELIDEHCGGLLAGHTLAGFLAGGTVGVFLSEQLRHVPLDFDTLQAYGGGLGSGSIVVLSQQDIEADLVAGAPARSLPP